MQTTNENETSSGETEHGPDIIATKKEMRALSIRKNIMIPKLHLSGEVKTYIYFAFSFSSIFSRRYHIATVNSQCTYSFRNTQAHIDGSVRLNRSTNTSPKDAATSELNMKTDNLRRRSNTWPETSGTSADLKTKHRVHFKNSVVVILIPSRGEYVTAGLVPALWWQKAEYAAFQKSAITEYSNFAKAHSRNELNNRSQEVTPEDNPTCEIIYTNPVINNLTLNTSTSSTGDRHIDVQRTPICWNNEWYWTSWFIVLTQQDKSNASSRITTHYLKYTTLILQRYAVHVSLNKEHLSHSSNRTSPYWSKIIFAVHLYYWFRFENKSSYINLSSSFQYMF